MLTTALKEKLKTAPDFLKEGLTAPKALAKWLFLATGVGGILGLLGSIFYYAISLATNLRQSNPWVIWLLPAAGALIALTYRLLHMENDPGTNLVIRSIHSADHIPLKMAPLIFLGTVITHFAGGSSGREGAALQLGGSIASFFGRRLRLPQKEVTIMTMCGMSAAFSALFGTPLTAAFFSLEVVSVGRVYYAALVPCLVASLVGGAVAKGFHISPTAFTVNGVPALSLPFMLRVMVLAALCAVVSVLFCSLTHQVGRWYKKYIPNPILRGAVGGALVLAITLLLGTQDYNGAGAHIIAAAIGGQARPEAFLLKILLTALTLGAGFKGGEIVPTFFVGATFGNVAGALLGLDPSFGAAVGLISLFCGVVNCPVTSLLLSLELFGSQGIIYFAMACGVSYMLSGYAGLYHEQRIMYDKTQLEYINRRAQ